MESPRQIPARLLATAVLPLALLALGGPAAADDEVPATIRRFALIAGANNGGPDRVLLKFANRDARSMERVLRELGGVSRGDIIRLTDPSKQALAAGFQRMGERLERAGGGGLRIELLFYFSGHSDEQGLLLAGERYPYRDIRDAFDELPADVRIAIVDSCASGALTRGKGGVRRPPFMVDNSSDVTGFAILTSSSADEAAQESDRVGGSFFTHYLVSGLRGAADSTRDNKITLNEAYAYAFHETLARTESTQAGPQHANYDFQLAGSGDLVLTDLRGTSALIRLDAAVDGRVFIRDEQGALVAEVNKPGGRSMSLGLEPGRYEVTLEQPAQLRRGTITLTRGNETLLAPSDLAVVEAEPTTARGGAAGSSEADPPGGPGGAAEEPLYRPVSAAFLPGVTSDMGVSGPVRNSFTANFIGWGDYLSGIEFSQIGAIRKADVKGAQLSGIFSYTHGSHYGLQLSGITNIGNGQTHGLQLSGIGNVVLGSGTGLRIGGIANLNRGAFVGAQIAGIANYVGDVNGLELSGIAGISRGGVTGLQLSGIANVAGGDVHGAQIGLVNFGRRVRGAQVGLLNIATTEMRGAQVGLANYAGDGILAPTIWFSDSSLLNLGLKMGSRHVYGILGAGLDPLGAQRAGSIITGLGGHIELDPFWLEIDLVSHQLIDTNGWAEGGVHSSVNKLRITVGYRIVKQLSVYLGPTLNCLVSDARTDSSLGYSFYETTVADDFAIQLSPGFVVGLQVEPQLGALNSRD